MTNAISDSKDEPQRGVRVPGVPRVAKDCVNTTHSTITKRLFYALIALLVIQDMSQEEVDEAPEGFLTEQVDEAWEEAREALQVARLRGLK